MSHKLQGHGAHVERQPFEEELEDGVARFARRAEVRCVGLDGAVKRMPLTGTVRYISNQDPLGGG